MTFLAMERDRSMDQKETQHPRCSERDDASHESLPKLPRERVHGTER
jgi:hypothetical protein